MDYTLVFDNGLVVQDNQPCLNASTKILTSLIVKKGSWFLDQEFGSRLHLLQRAKNTETTRLLVISYIEEALQWLVDAKEILNLEVVAERQAGKIAFAVTATDGGTHEGLKYSSFIEVI